MRRERRRWRTPLGRWMEMRTVHGLVDTLRKNGAPVTMSAPYNWLSGRCGPARRVRDVMERTEGGFVVRLIEEHVRKEAQRARPGR